MQIYTSEINDGLAEILSSKSSISYASLVSKSSKDNLINSNINFKALAGINDKDLYYTQSILVTTSWNKNDDVFDKEEVWLAKSTPTHKPTNLEHDEASIVGHITSNYPITDDGVLIDENTPADNLPTKFHILTGSVIYTGYTDPELRARAAKLIEEIEAGIKYVSMECFFSGFDYGLINKSTGEYKILTRNEETSFLTKYLRSYGGIGEHENYQIGRVLRNITFSGKGFVNRPANPESIIFTKDNLNFDKKVATIEILKEKNDNFENIGVFSNQANLQEKDMNLENEIAELKTQLEEANTQIQAKDAMTTEYMNKLGMSEEDKKKMKAEFDELLEQEVAAKKKMEEEMKAKNSELEAALNAANEVLAAYKMKEAEMLKKEKNMKRMATLVESGVDSELASATVEKFESLDDASFEAMSSLIAAVKPVKTVPGKGTGAPEKDWRIVKAEDSNETESAESTETKVEDVTEALENVEPEKDIDLSVGGETETEVNTTRAALVDFVRNRLGKKLNKGE